MLTAEDVCKILESCSKNGVRELKFAGLAVSLGNPPPSEHFLAPGPTNPGQSPENVIQAQEKVENLSQEEQGITLRERQIAELLITDPLLAEQLMENGELAPGTGEVNDGADE